MKPEKVKKRDKPLTAPQKEQNPVWLNFISAAFFNVIGAGVASVFLYVIFNNVIGYDWLLNTVLKSTFETIEKYPNLSVAERYELKWGGEIGYINRIKQQTPDSAIILIPPRKTLLQLGFKSSAELPWLTYFVYPRKVVYEDDKDSSKLYNKADYILSINGYGLDKVNYRIQKPEGFMILPIRR